jgi:hypothetical protein
MRAILIGFILFMSSGTAAAQNRVYEGTWVTTNRPLDGTMTCVVTGKSDGTWQGHFHGVWHGQAFSYVVRFSGPPEKLRGRAVIDGADYEWTGEITDRWFRGRFGGNRYEGSFSLMRKAQ